MILGDPRLRRDLARSVGRRVHAFDVDDVVQTTLAEALGAKALPSGPEDVRRFVFAIARQKVADVHRRRGREARCVWPDAEAHAPAPSNDVKRWLERTLPASPEVRRTFDWILREAEGETLAEIAANDHVSPAMVRQRVSRLRRWLRARWLKDVTMFTILGIVALSIAYGVVNRVAPRPEISRERAVPSSSPPPDPEPAPAILERPPPPFRDTPVRPPQTSPAPPPRPVRSGVTGEGPRATLHTRSAFKTVNGVRVVTEVTNEIELPSTSSLGVRTCATTSSRPGIGQVAVTIEPTGKVSHVEVSGPFTPTEIACVQKLYERVKTFAFTGDPIVARDFVSLVAPAAPPAWLTP